MSANYKEYKFSDLIEEVEERNISLEYGLDGIFGVTIEKGLIPTIANLTQTALDKFYIVKPDTFVYNPRTHGVRLGMGYNDTNKTFLTSWNNVAFRVKEDAKKIVLSKYLWIYFNRPEWDRQTTLTACFIMLHEKGAWQNRILKNILPKKNMKFSFTATRKLMPKSSGRGQRDIWVVNTITPSIQTMESFTVLNTYQKSF